MASKPEKEETEHHVSKSVLYVCVTVVVVALIWGVNNGGISDAAVESVSKACIAKKERMSVSMENHKITVRCEP